jgi:hypothetical protein
MEKFLIDGLRVYLLCILLSKGHLITVPCGSRTEKARLVVPPKVPDLDEEGC